MPSATAVDAPTFYVNLAAHNENENNQHRDHADILQMGEVQTLIMRILNDDPNPDRGLQYIEQSLPLGAGGLRFTLFSPVDIHAFDSSGRHTGNLATPDPLTGLPFEEGIPNSAYRQLEHTYLTLGTNDRYTVELRGRVTGTFSLKMYEHRDDSIEASYGYFDVPVTARSIATFDVQHLWDASPLRLDVEGDGTTDYYLLPGQKAESGVSLSILESVIRSLTVAIPIRKSLLAEVAAAKAALLRRANQTALGCLRAFQNEVQAQRGRGLLESDVSGLLDISNKIIASITK